MTNPAKIDSSPESIAQLLRQAMQLHQSGHPDQAGAIYRRILSLQPEHADALHWLGVACFQTRQGEEAIRLINRAIAIDPDNANYHSNLGKVFSDMGKPDQAIESYRRVLSLNPRHADIYLLVGNLYAQQRRADEAIESYRRALEIRPDLADAWHNLGTLLKDRGELDEAIDCLRKALQFKPDRAETYANLGGALRQQERLDEAIASFEQALALRPDFAEVYSNLLFLHAYHATGTPQDYLALARGWEQACVPAAVRDAARKRTFRRAPLTGRKLRVGYLSGDFRQHAVSSFIERLFARHDRSRVELYAYSTAHVRDAVTDRIAALVDHWLPAADLTEAALRDRIDADGVDVLVDLSGHTARNRLGVIARRAAPVQVHYVGFFASTGLAEMDYYLGDAILTPEQADAHFSETVWRLPRVSVSYQPLQDVPEPDWRPAEDGTVWLGSFNDLGKINPRTVALWARIMLALPEAKLLLKTRSLADVANRQRILDSLGSFGAPAERIELQGSSDWPDYMAQYNRLDIALDPVGGHGGYTTTCDALWMGVPVIHEPGDRATSRMSASMLDAIGHPEWIAHSEDEYIEKTVALARDVNRRIELRKSQRASMKTSPLCDAADLARRLEDAYSEMFQRMGSGL